MLNRLKNLEENIVSLEKMSQQFSAESLKENKFDEWALRYGIFESIQIVIDIACHIASKYNLGVSNSYSECIEHLSNSNYISKELSQRLLAAIGLRNLLIHEYITIDVAKLFSFLAFRDDFKSFAKEIADFI